MSEEIIEPTNDEVVETSSVETSAVDIEKLLEERNQYLELAQRVQADFENYRKRVSAQTADDVDRATGRIAEALLPVLDACEAAFVAHPAEVEPLFNLLLGELKKQGLEAMNLHGQPFDPALAEAVMQEPADGDGDGTTVVVDVLRSGYTWKGRVLRAALVKVKG
ncbi:MAG: nucleotide exchange factor GrpE [Acidimicrobiia bacterium]|nr:nucleotide exchange factor GrpE [Actinomycetota bacterium]NDE79959.1 nucleotide exchange factor GrpE [Actinomycetota bacterium]NDF30953.1 nucleotide exchange factor GrpE [Acidimicrobiia bacterium]